MMNLTCYLVGLQSIVDIMSSSLCDKKRWQEIVTGRLFKQEWTDSWRLEDFSFAMSKW